MKRHKSPLGAIVDGAIAGAAGSHAIGLFFATTQRWAPREQPDFEPPEQVQELEQPSETVARRMVEGLVKEGPLAPETKKLGGQLVHYGFGAAWGALFGTVAQSIPALCSPIGGALFGAKVWAVSHGLLLPALKLEAPPNQYSVAHHGYVVAAHLIYGATVMATFRALSSPIVRPLLLASAAALYLLRVPREERVPEEEPVIFEEPIETYIDPSLQPAL